MPSTLMIQVRISLKRTLFFCIMLFEKNDSKEKDAGEAHLKNNIMRSNETNFQGSVKSKLDWPA